MPGMRRQAGTIQEASVSSERKQNLPALWLVTKPLDILSNPKN